MIELAPIISGDTVNWTLSAIEIVAMIHGSVRINDLAWDEGALGTWYIETRVEPELQSAYREELRTALDEAKEATLSELVAEVQRRRDLLGAAYPFRVSLDDGILLEVDPENECLPQTACYMWMTLFNASQSSDDHLAMAEDTRAAIRKSFEKVFEIISAYAILGRADGSVWYLGASRSVEKLLRILGHVTRRIGSGTVKAKDKLLANQINANDAGIDVILVERQLPPAGYLVGATIQQTNRWKKIIGHDEVKRFHDFFEHRIGAVFLGVLATPYDPREDEKLNCEDRQCLYFNGDVIMEMLGRSVNCVARETRHLRYSLREYGRRLQRALIEPGGDPLVNCPWA